LTFCVATWIWTSPLTLTNKCLISYLRVKKVGGISEKFLSQTENRRLLKLLAPLNGTTVAEYARRKLAESCCEKLFYITNLRNVRIGCHTPLATLYWVIISSKSLQGWSCCQRRVTDFTEFLNMTVSFEFFKNILMAETLNVWEEASFYYCIPLCQCRWSRH
jgi:hypothetical protein